MASQKPFFSVIIPTLNEEDFIGRLFDNLISQTEKSFELIVVDGNSDDRTSEIITAYQTRLPVRLTASGKRSVSYQRNLGAAKAAGTYIIFFDADVQLSPGFLKTLKQQLERTQPPFVTTYLQVDSKEVQDKVFAILYNGILESSMLIEKPFVPGFNFIVRNDIFKLVKGFNEEIVHGEDYELALRIFQHGFPVTLLKKPRLVFSLRRYRAEGRLAVIRKQVMATLHVYTKGHIKKDLFSYPMGGGWYKTFKKKKPDYGLDKAERYVKKFVQLIFE